MSTFPEKVAVQNLRAKCVSVYESLQTFLLFQPIHFARSSFLLPSHKRLSDIGLAPSATIPPRLPFVRSSTTPDTDGDEFSSLSRRGIFQIGSSVVSRHCLRAAQSIQTILSLKTSENTWNLTAKLQTKKSPSSLFPLMGMFPCRRPDPFRRTAATAAATVSFNSAFLAAVRAFKIRLAIRRVNSFFLQSCNWHLLRKLKYFFCCFRDILFLVW